MNKDITTETLLYPDSDSDSDHDNPESEKLQVLCDDQHSDEIEGNIVLDDLMLSYMLDKDLEKDAQKVVSFPCILYFYWFTDHDITQSSGNLQSYLF